MMHITFRTASNAHSRQGFTLVELLVVITIITILAGMLLPALHRAQYTARNVTCVSNLKQQAQALNMFAGDHDNYWPYRGHPFDPQDGYDIYKRTSTQTVAKNFYDNALTGYDTNGNPIYAGGDLVWQLAEYTPHTVRRGASSGHPSSSGAYPSLYNTNSTDASSDTLSPVWVCPLYSGAEGGFKPLGCLDHGMACAHFPSGWRSYMSYSLFVAAGPWRDRVEPSLKAGEHIDFGMDWPHGGVLDNPVLLNSPLLVADWIDWKGGGATDPVRIHHRPGEGDYEFEQGGWNDFPKARYVTYDGFSHNAATQDGAVFTTYSNWGSVYSGNDFGRLEGSGHLVPLKAGKRP